MKVMLAVAFLALMTAFSASAATSRTSTTYKWFDPDAAGNAIEQYGYYNPTNAKKLPVDTAFCYGLRRYGVKTSSDGYTDLYKRAKCDVQAANGHDYEGTFIDPPGGWRMLDFHLVY